MDWRDSIWFFDVEVFPNDWLLCAESMDGRRVQFVNDYSGVAHWLNRENPLLCGYNCKHYDMYILKGIIVGATPPEIKGISDFIIEEKRYGWEIDMGWVKMPNSIDLMLDLPTRPSLKQIEGNLLLDIRESSVAFDTETLTDEQWEDVINYCWHDVGALRPLYEARKSYLDAKELLAEMVGLPPEHALNMTNAKLTATFLKASKVDRNDERQYVYPDNLKREYIPKEVFEFFDRLPNSDIPLDILFGREGVPDDEGKVVKSRNPYRNLTLDIAGCVSVVAWGGLHGALSRYQEEASEDRVIVNSDVTSYYPYLMVKNDYLSRNVPDASVFEDVLERRIQAKAEGDVRTSDALKLVVNTTYGASNNKYNDLYDPLQAHSVCISGQLYLIQLAEEMVEKVPTIRFIQLNTDGIMYSVNKEYLHKAKEVIQEWEKLTGFTLENEFIEKIIQRDVNNYVLRKTNGKVLTKGSVLRSWSGGDFNHNSLGVIANSIVQFLLDGKSITETINNENDVSAFQRIVKAGGTFEEVVHQVGEEYVPVNRVNRIYAGLDTTLGVVYKVKDGSRHRIPNCPPHTIVDNSGKTTIDNIDRAWYIRLATKRAYEFITEEGKRMSKEELEVIIEEDEKMSEEKKKKETPKKVEEGKKTTTTKAKTTTPKTTEVSVTFQEKLFNLGEDVAKLASRFIKDGYNSGQNYEYVRAHQYKTIFQKALRMNRLRHKVDDVVSNVENVLNVKTMVLTQYHGILTIFDVDSDENEKYMLWSQGSDSLDKGLSKAKTLAIKDFLKLNYLIDDSSDDPEADVGQPKKTFIPPAQTKEIAKEVVKEKVSASTDNIERAKKAILAIREASGEADYGEKILVELEKADISETRVEVILTRLELRGDEYGLEI